MAETEVDKKTDSVEMETGQQSAVKNARVLPWDKVEHEIPIKSFGGYEIKLNGYIRHDIREQRLQEQMRQQELLKQGLEEEKKAAEKQTTDSSTTAPATAETAVKLETTVEAKDTAETVAKEQEKGKQQAN